MAAQHPLREAPSRRAPLLLGPGGDLALIDLTGADGAEVRRRLGPSAQVGARPAVAVLGATPATAPEAAEAAALVVVVAVDGGRADLAGARALVAAGLAAAQVVVEVPFGAEPVPVAAVRAVEAAGFSVGAALAPPAGLVVDADRRVGPPDRRGGPAEGEAGAEGAAPGEVPATAADGWQIGALVGAIGLDLRTVRGVAPARFRRVAAVVARTEQAVRPRAADPAHAEGAPS